MANQVLFIHGAGDGAHQEDQALVDNLQEGLGAVYTIHYPKMPKEAHYRDKKRLGQSMT